MNILELLSNKNYIAVNKVLVKALGLEEAIILGELASEYEYWNSKELLDDDYFYSTVENIEQNTSLTEYKQRKALNTLKELKIIDIKIGGIPAKRYIKINQEQVLEKLSIQFLKNLRTSSEKIKELELKKLKGNNNIINKNKNNNNIKENKKEKYGTYGRVKLTDSEYSRLITEFGKDFIDSQIKLLDEYVESNNNKNKYVNFNLVLRRSIREKWFNKDNEASLPEWFDKDYKEGTFFTNEQRRKIDSHS